MASHDTSTDCYVQCFQYNDFHPVRPFPTQTKFETDFYFGGGWEDIILQFTSVDFHKVPDKPDISALYKGGFTHMFVKYENLVGAKGVNKNV